ncbi:MAG: BNR-4 repeat-containing protein, partial [Anaerolineales bacterium]|nr:BNR-4 repeat-containing protein [Anaerolineales bacterium]
LSSWVEKDDHNNPALLPLSPDSLLAVYARHNTQKEFNSRIISRNFQMGPQQVVDHPSSVTYSNLYRLENEGGKIYNFFRGEGWFPNLVNSNDQGKSWSEPTMIFLSGDNSTRPYVKYASDNLGRIDLFYTDGHPGKEPANNVYHAYYEDGKFCNSKGKKIRMVEEIKEKPLLPGEGTLIFDGSGESGRGWVHDFERGEDGELSGVFISSPDGDEGLDLRYHYARFDPKKRKWLVNEVGFAGPHLYVPENHYAGGICIDPDDLNVVWLSSTLHPATGEHNGTGRYQIYKGVTPDQGQTWSFEQITFDVKRDNLRPVVPRNRPEDMNECVVWFRGHYNTYIDYNCEIVGIVPSKEKDAPLD